MHNMPSFIKRFCFFLILFLLIPTEAGASFYTLQIGSFKNKSNAEELSEKIRSKGYDTYLKSEKTKNDSPWHVVYVGPYSTQEEARKASADLSRNKFIKTPLVITENNSPATESSPQPIILAQTKQQQTDATPAAAASTASPVLKAEKKQASQKDPETTSPPKDKQISQQDQSNKPLPVSPLLAEGINQYKEENYEEAIEILTKVRRQDKTASAPAFFLGLAYKQTNDYQKSLEQFREAVTLKPPIKEAVVELIDLLNQLDQLDEAMKWIDVAEKNNIIPAKTAFLKGMILSKKGQYDAAVASFEKSKQLEASYSQAADFQIALAYMGGRQYSKAKERFQAAVTRDPLSDLGTFARRYQDIVEEQSFLQRPLRVTIGLTAIYDTNMLLEPGTYPGLPDSGNERSLALGTSMRLDYVPILSNRWLFNASLAAASRLNQENSTRYDMFATTVSAAPGYDFGRFALNVSGNYTFALKRGDYFNNGGGYRRYSENSSVGPLLRFLINNNNIMELYSGYAKKNYFKPAPVGNPGDDQTACGLDSYASWMWLFENGGLFNLRFNFGIDNADGIYWDSKSYKVSANIIYPVWKKISLQLGGEFNIMPYTYENQNFNNTVRLDKIYTGMVGFNWNINRNLNAVVSYTGTLANSNIFIYDYTRSLWQTGVELRF